MIYHNDYASCEWNLVLFHFGVQKGNKFHANMNFLFRNRVVVFCQIG